MTLYPESKCSPARAVDMFEVYGAERLWMNSACDWGVSIPWNCRIPPWNCAAAATAGRDRPLHLSKPGRFLSQCPKFRLWKWLSHGRAGAVGAMLRGMQIGHGIHLAYCTNIHRGESWAETLANLSSTPWRCANACRRAGPTPSACG